MAQRSKCNRALCEESTRHNNKTFPHFHSQRTRYDISEEKGENGKTYCTILMGRIQLLPVKRISQNVFLFLARTNKLHRVNGEKKCSLAAQNWKLMSVYFFQLTSELRKKSATDNSHNLGVINGGHHMATALSPNRNSVNSN